MPKDKLNDSVALFMIWDIFNEFRNDETFTVDNLLDQVEDVLEANGWEVEHGK